MRLGCQRHTRAALPLWKNREPLYEAGWVPGPVRMGAENLASTGIRSPERPTQSIRCTCYAIPARTGCKWMNMSNNIFTATVLHQQTY